MDDKIYLVCDIIKIKKSNIIKEEELPLFKRQDDCNNVSVRTIKGSINFEFSTIIIFLKNKNPIPSNYILWLIKLFHSKDIMIIMIIIYYIKIRI